MNAANEKIYELLDKMHGGADCELDFRTPFELLVAVILSAQCTDKRVNMITEELFKTANTPEDFAAMPVEELEKIFKKMITYCEKQANGKDQKHIESKFIRYEADVKAK